MMHKPNKACAEKVETRPERKEAKMENNASYGGSYGNSGKKLPEKKFRAGAVSATIWRNESAKGSYATVQLDRSYKDGDAWKSTGSLRIKEVNRLPEDKRPAKGSSCAEQGIRIPFQQAGAAGKGRGNSNRRRYVKMMCGGI
ncbi:hypothetical protein HYU15_03805 [Candidatus Woesearchaeota archaeon]|nr:hypothetical protein [Candidatus Woesearchaeota archaeon]